jgi:hypothetical protein
MKLAMSMPALIVAIARSAPVHHEAAGRARRLFHCDSLSFDQYRYR